MRRALAIETSGRVGSVAVLEDGAILAEEAFPHEMKHAAGLVPLMHRLVGDRGWTPASLDELYVSAGPGSFTGLRIGVTAAKTLALVTGLKLVAVPTLRVLAANAPSDAQQVVVVLDAKRDQIFTARYERVGREWVEREPAHLDTLVDMVERAPRPVHLLGDGLPHHERHLTGDRAGLVFTPPDTWRGRAGNVGKIGFAMARSGHFTGADQLLPVYVRRPEAEEKLEATLDTR